jgi:ferredoxin
MANKITEECIQCGACETECPNQAITSVDGNYVINAAKCDECVKDGGEMHCKAVCPADAAIVKA